MTAYMFLIDLMVRGYYDYQSIWDNPMADGDFPCEWEMGNAHDLQVVAIKKTIHGTLQVFRCMPRKISSIYLIFLSEVAVLHSRKILL